MVSGINLWASINKFQSQPTKETMQTTSSATHNLLPATAASLDGRSALVATESMEALGFFFGYYLGFVGWDFSEL